MTQAATTTSKGRVAPGVEEQITFLYYRDVASAAQFYSDVMGFPLAIDQGFCKIFRVAGTAYLGVVDETRGYHRANAIKPVEITLLVPDVDEWYEYIRTKGIQPLTEPHTLPDLNLRMFLLHDPEGYVIEIQKFL